jgi:hypothetical protein
MIWYSESGAHNVYICYVCIHGSHILFVDTTYRFRIMIRRMFCVASMSFKVKQWSNLFSDGTVQVQGPPHMDCKAICILLCILVHLQCLQFI